MKKIIILLFVAFIAVVAVVLFQRSTTTSSLVPSSEEPFVANTDTQQEVPTYIGDQGIEAAEAEGWTKFSNENSDGPNLSFYLPKGFSSSCAGTDTYSACEVTKVGVTTPDVLVVFYLGALDSEYISSGFSAEGTNTQYGYTDGWEYLNVTMKESKAFSALNGITLGATPVNAFAFESIETAPYHVLVLDPGMNWQKADWVTFLSTVVLIGKL